MFSLTYNRVHTEKPFFNPTYELFKSFYEDDLNYGKVYLKN